MKIIEVTIDGFGIWQGLHLPDLDRSPVVLYGPNEAGKTTILEFLRAMFFGLLEPDARRYLPPRDGAVAGGSLLIQSRFGVFRLQRSVDASCQPWREQLHIAAADGTPAGPHLLSTLMGSVDRAVFHNVFALGLDDLQQLDSLQASEAARYLYGLASGTDRVSLPAVRDALDSSREAILGRGPGGPADSMAGLLDERAALREQYGVFARRARQWRQLLARRRQIELKIAACREAGPRLATDQPLEHGLPHLRACWQRCRQLQQELTDQPGGEIPDAALTRLDRLAAERGALQQKADALRQQAQSMRRELKGMAVPELPAADWSGLFHLEEQRGAIAALDQQIAGIDGQLEELEFELQGELEKHGLKTGESPLPVERLGCRSYRALRQPARLLARSRRQLRVRQAKAEESKILAGQLEGEYREAERQLGLAEGDGNPHRLRDRAEALRARMDLQEQLERIGRQVQHSETQLQQWGQRMIVPWRWLLVLFGLFSLGISLMLVALLGGWMGLSLPLRGHLTWIGLVLSVSAMLLKKGAEMLAAQQARAAQRRLDHWQQERQALLAQRDILDARLPSAGGPWVQQLQQVQLQLQQSERLAPLHQRWQQTRRAWRQADHRASEARRQLARARRSWRLALRTVGLPEQLTPGGALRLLRGDPAVNRIRRRHAEAQERRAALLRQREAFAQQAEAYRVLLAPVEAASADGGLAEEIEQLASAARGAQQQARSAARLRRRLQKARREQEQIELQIQQNLQEQRKLLDQLGSPDEEEVRKRFARQKQLRAWREERDALLADLARALHPRYSADQLADELEGRHPETLEETLDAWQDEYADSQSLLAELHQTLGRIQEQLQAHAGDRRRATWVAQWKAINERIRQAAERWTTQTLAAQILHAIQKSYERERQPQTLTEASLYLQQLTDGRYTRVWNPLGAQALRVDRRDGEALPLEKLSRGSREQVYLALRLALAADFARRGMALPMVLDDVLVNFDSSRAAGAARAVQTYAAQGGQILVLTCHEHIRDAFQLQGIAVRSLPAADRPQLSGGPAPTEAAETVCSDRHARETTDPAPLTVRLPPRPVPAADAPTGSAPSTPAGADTPAMHSAPSDSAPTAPASTDSTRTDSAASDAAPIDAAASDTAPPDSTPTESAATHSARRGFARRRRRRRAGARRRAAVGGRVEVAARPTVPFAEAAEPLVSPPRPAAQPIHFVDYDVA